MPTKDKAKIRVQRRRWYEKHREQKVKLSKKHRQARRAENRAFLVGYLDQHGCTDCGESDRVVLDFDHVRGKKVMGVPQMADLGYSFRAVIKEVEKCEVRCANCHRRRHAK